ncbi:MAG: recombination mediator RecR [Clostridiales Family XIII bacterium]|jgi:recombination protein RecR|nr:recombination mediator RecR [Clostridiales Family XIII bacterium]
MAGYPKPLEKLINEISKLPGIGGKTAQRLAFFIMSMEDEDAKDIARAIVSAKDNLKRCSVCGNMTDVDPCEYCTDPTRQDNIICVVESPKDVLAIERSKEYRGRYHVLHGVISPIDDMKPDDLNLKSLLIRLRDNEAVNEIILATSTTIEGEATAMYISRLVSPSGIKVTRIAHGVPMGGDLEYADEMTLMKAIEGRREI